MMWYEYIINFIFTIISFLVYIYCYKKVFKEVFKLKKTLVFLILLFCLIMFLNNQYNNSLFKFISSFLITSIIYKILYKIQIRKSLIFTFLIYLVACILEILIVGLIYIIILRINILKDSLFVKCAITTIHSFILILLFSWKKLLDKIKKSYDYLFSFLNNDILIILIIIIINMLYVYYASNISITNIILFIIIIGGLLFVFNIYIIEKSKKEKYKIRSQYLTNLVEKYESIIKEYKELKHNLINDFLSIKSEMSSELIDEKINKYSKNYEWISTIEMIPQGIQGLIYLKSEQAQRQNIHFVIENNNIKNKDISFKHKTFSSINDALGIYLDNAIDAVKRIKEKKVYINLNKTKHHFIIEIINEINSSVNIDKLGTLNYSTKQEKSGIGLDYARKISKGKFKIFTNIINNYFKVTLKINISK